MTNVVNVISKKLAPMIIKFVPANWPADVRLENDIKMAIQTGIPPDTAISPKVNDTGIYPNAIGSPRLKPYLKSLD